MKIYIKILFVTIFSLAANYSEGSLVAPSVTNTINATVNLKATKMAKEIWKDIKGYEGLYQISNLGDVKSLERVSIQSHLLPELILKQGKSRYRQVELCDKYGKATSKLVHRLVALNHIDNPENKPCVNHIDGDKWNNRNDNLEWCTYRENNIHAYKNGLSKPPMKNKHGSKHVAAKKIEINCIENGNKELFHSIIEAALYLKTKPQNISRVLTGKRNKHKGHKFNYV